MASMQSYIHLAPVDGAGALTAAVAGEESMPSSDYRALEVQVRELHLLLDKTGMENELP